MTNHMIDDSKVARHQVELLWAMAFCIRACLEHSSVYACPCRPTINTNTYYGVNKSVIRTLTEHPIGISKDLYFSYRQS